MLGDLLLTTYYLLLTLNNLTVVEAGGVDAGSVFVKNLLLSAQTSGSYFCETT